MPASPFIFGGNTGQTSESVKRLREHGQVAQQAGSSTAPVGSAVEGVARALEGGLGGYFEGVAERQAQAEADPWAGMRQTTAAAGAPPPAAVNPAATQPQFPQGGFMMGGSGFRLPWQR